MTDRKPWDLTDRGPRKIAGLLTTPDRLTAWAEWFDLTPPPIRYTRGKPKTPDYLLYTPELLDWMLASHGSLDWFVEGDARGMAVVICRDNARLAEFGDAVGRMDEQERGWLLDVLKSGLTGDDLQVALDGLTARVRAHRGEKVEADPLPALWADWQRLRDAYNDWAQNEEGPEGLAIWTEFMAVEDRLRSTVATTPEGLLAQFDYMAEDVLGKGNATATVSEIVVPFIAAFRAGLEGRQP